MSTGSSAGVLINGCFVGNVLFNLFYNNLVSLGSIRWSCSLAGSVVEYEKLMCSAVRCN